MGAQLAATRVLNAVLVAASAGQVSTTQPAATQPAATQPAATQPAATQPAATQPAATQPAATQPAATTRSVVGPTSAPAVPLSAEQKFLELLAAKDIAAVMRRMEFPNEKPRGEIQLKDLFPDEPSRYASTAYKASMATALRLYKEFKTYSEVREKLIGAMSDPKLIHGAGKSPSLLTPEQQLAVKNFDELTQEKLRVFQLFGGGGYDGVRLTRSILGVPLSSSAQNGLGRGRQAMESGGQLTRAEQSEWEKGRQALELATRQLVAFEKTMGTTPDEASIAAVLDLADAGARMGRPKAATTMPTTGPVVRPSVPATLPTK